jgi:Flp pilus assembly pilin Flp
MTHSLSPTQRRRQAGQSMTEVIVIVFLVAIGSIGVAGLFGDNIRNLFGASSGAVAGNPSVSNTGKETTRTKWNLKGGSLSAYGANGGGFNPAGSPGAPPPSGGGFNPGGSSSK